MYRRSPVAWLAASLLIWGTAAVAQVATGPATNITSDQNRVNTRGSMSLDGKKIAYTYPSLATGLNQVWVMNSDGTGKQRVTWSISDTFNSETVAYEWPSLNADGTQLVMHAWDTGSSTEVVGVDLASGTAVQITSNPAYDAYPAFSPDGSKILFLSKRDNANEYQVYVMNPAPESATNVPVALTTDFVGTKYARFTPDGLHIIVGAKTTLNPDNFQVVMMDVAGGANKRLVTNVGSKDSNEPSQMTSGGRIYFVANYSPDGKRHVYSCMPDGSGTHQVSAADYEEYFAFAAGNKLMTTFVDRTLGDTAATGGETAFFNADIATYDLAATTGNGTISGTVQTAPGKAVSGSAVAVYDGLNVVASVTTDAAGNFTASVPTGGYTVQVSTSGGAITFGAIVKPGATTSRNVFVDEPNSPRPTGVVPTISGASVDIRWEQAPDGGLVPPLGYNVYRGASESGPWVKANLSVIAQSGTPSFVDTAPGNLLTAFYVVTCVSSDGITNYESAPSDVAQAANNLVYNASFEDVDGNGIPVGWKVTSWGDTTNVVGTDTTEHATGGRSVYMQSGDTQWSFVESMPRFEPPATPGEKYLEGVYVRLKDAPSSSYVNVLHAFSRTEPDEGGTDWYSWDDYAMDSFSGSSTDGNHPWAWIHNSNFLNVADEATYTRLSLSWPGGGGTGTTAGVSRAYWDEMRYQVRRIGATGVIVGRTFAPDGSALSGVAISAGGQTTTSDSGFYTLRNVPSGPLTLTATIAGQTVTQDILNAGGCRTNVSFTSLPALSISGTVYHSDGTTPAANASVMLAYSDGSAAAPQTMKTTADANGQYSFATPIKGTGETAISASLPEYAEGVTVKTLGLFGPATVNVDLGDSAPVLYVVKTATPPTIDGVVNASEWGASQVIPVTFGAASTINTKAYMLWDSTALYVAFVGDEPNPAGMLAKASAQDDSLLWYTGVSWNADDAYGVWLDANRGGSAGLGYEQLQLLCNSNQTSPSLADIAWRDFMPNTWDDTWTSGTVWKATVNATSNTYSVEMKIPYSGLAVGGIGAPTVTAGDYWRGRLNRHRNQPITDVTTGDGGMDWAATDTSWNTFKFVTSLSTKGDVNSDGSINNTDVLLALKIAAGIEAVGGRIATADVTGTDAKVTLEDAVKILRKVTGVAPVL